MTNTLDGLLTSYSWNHAIRADKVLREKGFQAALIPVPREFSSNCGTSLQFEYARREEAEAALNDSGVKYEAVYRYTPELERQSGETKPIRKRVRGWLAAFRDSGA